VPVWDRRAEQLFHEFMDDAPQTYETRPERSVRQWLEAQPLYDRIIALYQESRFSRKKIAPFIRKHGIDMSVAFSNALEPRSVRRAGERPVSKRAGLFDRRARSQACELVAFAATFAGRIAPVPVIGEALLRSGPARPVWEILIALEWLLFHRNRTFHGKVRLFLFGGRVGRTCHCGRQGYRDQDSMHILYSSFFEPIPAATI